MNRNRFIERIHDNFRMHPAVALLGPRQCGKTTLANTFAAEDMRGAQITRFDLEDPRDIAQLENPMLALENLEGLIIIDEIQRRPDLFPILRVLIDRNREKSRFLILGSASRDLLQQSSETLAGRIAYIEVTPFSYTETHEMENLWIRGGFPLAYLAPTKKDSFSWIKNYTATFLERDIPNLGINISPVSLRKFWMMLAHYHGNIINMSEIGRSLGVSYVTIRNYIEVLSSTFMVRQLQPWFSNINKRQVKSPKIYFKDSGILHYLLDIENKNDLLRNPKLGASWEGFALEQIIRTYEVDPESCYFWAIHSQAELDLLIIKEGRRHGFEFKYTDAPRLTKSMLEAQNLLELDSLTVLYPGQKNYLLKSDIQVKGLEPFLLERSLR